MNQQIDTYQNDTAEIMPMAPVNTNVLDQLKQQAESWSAAAQIAEQLARTDFAGPFKGKPGDMTAAILKGAEIGIPAASIGKAIYVVHGTPALYGKTALSIALQHGYIVETLEDTPQAVAVKMTAPHGQEMEVRYTIERAEQEGLVKGNSAQYKSRPSKMLYWKCVGELTDRMIPHLTGGMPLKEDAEQSPVKMQAVRTDRKGNQRGGAGVMAALQSRKPEPEPEPVAEPADDGIGDLVQQYLADIAAAETMDMLGQIAEAAQGQFGNTDDYQLIRESLNQRASEVQ